MSSCPTLRLLRHISTGQHQTTRTIGSHISSGMLSSNKYLRNSSCLYSLSSCEVPRILPEDVRKSLNSVLERFKLKYKPAPITLWKRASAIWHRDQLASETVDDYIAEMVWKAKEAAIDDDMLRYAVMRGIHSQYRPYVMQQNPDSISSLLEAAKVAEATIDAGQPSMSELLDAINQLQARPMASITQSMPTPRSTASTGPLSDLPSTFVVTRTTIVQLVSWTQRTSGSTPPPASTMNRTSASSGRLCQYCGLEHNRGSCPAFGKQCRACGIRNHFARCCRRK